LTCEGNIAFLDISSYTADPFHVEGTATMECAQCTETITVVIDEQP
jgi:hypothetical protein